MAKWERIGSINDSKYGGYTFKVDKACTLDADERLTMIKPLDNLESLRDKGIISDEEFEERAAKLPDFVKYLVFKTPPKGE